MRKYLFSFLALAALFVWIADITACHRGGRGGRHGGGGGGGGGCGSCCGGGGGGGCQSCGQGGGCPTCPMPGVSTNATIVLNVPEGSVVEMDGYRVKSTGTKRVLATPALQRGWEYTYRVSCDGQEHVLRVRAGKTSVIHFTPIPTNEVSAGATFIVQERYSWR